MFTIDSIKNHFDPEKVITHAHETAQDYISANFCFADTAPLSNVLYLSTEKTFPESVLHHPSCGAVFLPCNEEYRLPTGNYECEWCAIDTDCDPSKLLYDIQNTILSSRRIIRLKELRDRAMVEGTAIQPLALQICKIIDNPIAVYDTAYHVLALESMGRQVDNKIWQTAYTRGVFSPEIVGEFRRTISDHDLSATPFLCDTNAWEDMRCLVMQIVSNTGELLGSVAVYEAFHKFEAEDCELMKCVAELLSDAIKRQTGAVQAKETNNAFICFINELIDGVQYNPETFSTQFPNRNYEMYRLGYIRLAGDPALQRQCNFFCRELTNISPRITVFQRMKNIVLLFGADSPEEMTVLIESVKEVLDSNSICMGLTNYFFSLSNLEKSYDMVKSILKTGEAVLPDNAIYDAKEIALLNTIENLPINLIKDIYLSSSFHYVCEYDRLQQTNYAETLVVYLKNMFRTVSTAAELYIHKNSLLYRLGRYNQLFGIDISNIHDVSEFWLGYKIAMYLDSIENTKKAKLE